VLLFDLRMCALCHECSSAVLEALAGVSVQAKLPMPSVRKFNRALFLREMPAG
jgi:hypothetical protein